VRHRPLEALIRQRSPHGAQTVSRATRTQLLRSTARSVGLESWTVWLFILGTFLRFSDFLDLLGLDPYVFGPWSFGVCRAVQIGLTSDQMAGIHQSRNESFF